MKRKLYVLLGPPGSGKSSWIDREGLKDYTVSLDQVRALLGGYDQRDDGKFEVQTRKEKTLWKLFYDIVEDRVANGERTFIDAPNVKRKYWNKYSEIARKHNAEIVCVDFRGQSLAELKQRNENRMDNKFVSPKDLMKSVDNAESLELDECIQRVKPDQFVHFTKSKSFNHYDEIYHIGDIHGSIEPLKEFFEDGLKNNALYIFLGDYIDRGSNNAEVIQLLESIAGP